MVEDLLFICTNDAITVEKESYFGELYRGEYCTN